MAMQSNLVGPIPGLSRRMIRFDPRFFMTQGREGDARNWHLYDARRSRQAIYWGHFENSIYEAVNAWAHSLKEYSGLYEYIRPIYNPGHRLGEFWATHIFGGPLDPHAGPGDPELAAIPIITTNDDLRAAISLVWEESNWGVHKETLARFGSVMGDTFATIEDNADHQTVAIRVIDPRTILDVEEDSQGNVRGYIISEMRPDPEIPFGSSLSMYPTYVEYREVCRRAGDLVIYQTFKDDQPYDWNDRDRTGRAARGHTWSEGYGFVPMVHIQHKDIGLGWGAGEMYGLLPKIYELDDQASKLGDQVRKSVDPDWFFTGVDLGNIQDDSDLQRDHYTEAFECTTGFGVDGMPMRVHSQKGRDKAATLHTPEANAKAMPLVAPLDLAGVLQNIAGIMKAIEQQHPELVIDSSMSNGDVSGKALRTAREKAETLVTQRRSVYDKGMVALHQMAISIGAMQQYPGFDKFTAQSYRDGELAHSIGPRPVFAMNEGERLDLETERANLVKTFTDAGVPLVVAWKRAGYPDSDVQELVKERKEELDFKLQAIQLQQKQAAADGASYGKHGTLQQ
jgi:hypothetical protein